MNAIVTRIATASAFAAALFTIGTTATAQERECALRVGVIGAANYNYVDAPLEEMTRVAGNPGFATHDFSQAGDFEAYYGVKGEYLFNNQFGVMLRAAVDGRCVSKEDNGSTFSPRMLYINIDPGVRVSLGMPELYVMAGGTVAVKASAKYDYTPSAGEGAVKLEDVEMTDARDVAYGAWLGFGYDIRLNESKSPIGWYVSPFVEGSYLFDQTNGDLASQDKTWNTLTGRVGVSVMAQF